MASLSEDDLEKLFSGAPQYFARSEGHFTGAPHPSVAYPWDETLQIRDLTDHVQIGDEAWSNVTAWPHLTRRFNDRAILSDKGGASHDINGSSHDNDDDHHHHHHHQPIKKRSHFYPRCRERPSMLSIQGLEKGTVGYQAALELAVSDALEEEQYGFGELCNRPAVIIAARRGLMDPRAGNAMAPGGVKYVGESQILEELIKNGRRYAAGTFYDERQANQFYHELFHNILRAPAKRRSRSFHSHTRSGSGGGGDDGDSIEERLIPQIEALLDVLATPNVWIDFSHVEWRLRLGQILFTSSVPDEIDPGSATTTSTTASDAEPAEPAVYPAASDGRYTERYWLLLQILIATELLLRLDAITEGDEYGLEYVRPSEVHRFEKVASPSVRWSLILARTWLENIEVVRVEGDTADSVKLPSGNASVSICVDQDKQKSPQQHTHDLKHTIGWITTLTRKLAVLDSQIMHTAAKVLPIQRHVYAMKAQNAERQYRGLAHFAQGLRWPNDLVNQSVHFRELLNTKVPAASTQPSAQATAAHLTADVKLNRRLVRRRKVVAALHAGGWLSRSYMSGLMLPGDVLCTVLMATLLEGDGKALQELGSVAHLGSGFVYSGKSFWNTACVVGRVLAAGAGAAECMGWVSSDVVPRGRDVGWLNVDVDDVADDIRQTNRRARIWGKAAIERESSVVGDSDMGAVLPAHFFLPYETVYKETPPRHTTVELQHLDVSAVSGAHAKAQAETSVALSETCVAQVSFAVTSDGGPAQTMAFHLAYDVYFVTAHPCVPSRRVKVLKSQSSPTIQQIDVTGSGSLAGRGGTVQSTGHALHKYYKYASIHLTSLLRQRDKSLEELLVEYLAVTTVTPPSRDNPDNTVLVIDCMTGFQPQPTAQEMPLSPVVDRKMSFSGSASSGIASFPPLTKEISPIVPLGSDIASPDGESGGSPTTFAAVATRSPPPLPTMAAKMHHETRRWRFGSDMEILVRALCAEKGWNALISRRRRGCLACAIREASALGWKVVVRVD